VEWYVCCGFEKINPLFYFDINKMDTIKFITLLISCFLLIFLLYKISQEIRDDFEDKVEDPYVLSLISELRHIDPSVNNIVDKLKFYEGNKSYTINKTYVHLCKYDKNGMLYNKNQLVLVLLHEVAHALCDEVGHTDKFQSILDDLLIKAEKHRDKKGNKLYDPNIPHVQDYCNY
jgi:hypothetical protein